MSLRHLVLTALLVTVTSNTSYGQFYGGGSGCNSCGTVTAPISTACTPIQPVYSSCYETVPVTTYTQEKQTVQVPYYETAYEDREVTLMKPVTSQRTVEVPTVSYQSVVENRTVNRDMGRWQTNYFPNQKCAPCQVDPRPGVIGWLNRTGYSFKNAFTPNYRTTQTYVPRMVTCNVPVTRQVAVQGTRQVVVSDVKMVAERTTQRVAVQKLAYKTVEQTVMRPQTAYRTVPIGSTLAYGYGGGYYGGGTSTAWIVGPDSTQTARRPEADPISGGTSQSAQAPFAADPATPRTGDKTFQRDNGEANGKFQRSSFEQPIPPATDEKLRQPPQTFPADPPAFQGSDSDRDYRGGSARPSYTSTSPPAATGGWKVSRRAAMSSTAARDTSIPGLSMTAPK